MVNKKNRTWEYEGLGEEDAIIRVYLLARHRAHGDRGL